MTAEKRLGIWMDHSSANLIAFTATPSEKEVIVSAFTHEEKEHALGKSEHLMHNKEQQQQSAYYNKLGGAIKEYDHVILFGPTDAKTELLNILKADQHFTKIKIEVQQAGKMTENQQQAFVQEYFSKH
jgi:hypothetical protein